MRIKNSRLDKTTKHRKLRSFKKSGDGCYICHKRCGLIPPLQKKKIVEFKKGHYEN